MACYCEDGWVCETHPDKAMGHGRCHGAGMHCLNPACRYGRENRKREAIDDQINRERYPDLFAPPPVRV